MEAWKWGLLIALVTWVGASVLTAWWMGSQIAKSADFGGNDGYDRTRWRGKPVEWRGSDD